MIIQRGQDLGIVFRCSFLGYSRENVEFDFELFSFDKNRIWGDDFDKTELGERIWLP